MPVYKLILPVISFSPQGTSLPLRRPEIGVSVKACKPQRQTTTPEISRADDGQTPPSTDKPFG